MFVSCVNNYVVTLNIVSSAVGFGCDWSDSDISKLGYSSRHAIGMYKSSIFFPVIILLLFYLNCNKFI